MDGGVVGGVTALTHISNGAVAHARLCLLKVRIDGRR
jgi:hypothetical protein